MSLPISENRTVATNQRVSRADVLSIQDCQIAAYQRGMRRLWFRTIPALLGQSPPAETWPIDTTGIYRESQAGTDIIAMAAPLPVGCRVFQLYARVYGGGGAAIAAGLYRSPYAAPAAVSVVTVSGASSAAWTTLTSSSISGGHVIEAGYRYWVRVTAGQAADRIIWARLSVDRP